jgi:hypothetical protein
MPCPSTGELPTLQGVWGSSGRDVYAVDYNQGRILHYDGSDWEVMVERISRGLSDIWGSCGSDVFVVGEGGSILHYSGDSPCLTGPYLLLL